MKWQLTAVLATALVFSACGGGNNNGIGLTIPSTGTGGGSGGGTGGSVGGGSGNGGHVVTPTPTEVGSPVGIPVSAVIGVVGGQVSTADGELTVVVPAGAFTSDQTVSIQEITSTAPGANGRAYRISPEGLHTPIPMTVRFHYNDNDLTGTALAQLSIAYQDATHIWHRYKTPVVDAPNRTLSVQTQHFSDWSRVAGVQLLPNKATVQVGQSIELLVVHCENDESGLSDDDLLVPAVVYECAASPLDAYSSTQWSVNGAEGGGGQYGTIVPNADRWSGKATYTAPATKPTQNVVSVSTVHQLVDGFQLLVANITIEDQPLGCDGFKAVDKFNAELAFDSFQFTATAEDRRHTGTHAGRLVGTLKKIETGPSLGFWVTYLAPLSGGQVTINDSYAYTPPSGDGYSGTLNANGAPHDAPDAPSFIGLKVNYASCTYELFGSFAVDGTAIHNGQLRNQVIGIGGLYVFEQTIAPEQRGATILQGTRTVRAGTDIQQTNYVPLQPEATTWTITGSTTARWSISPAQ